MRAVVSSAVIISRKLASRVHSTSERKYRSVIRFNSAVVVYQLRRVVVVRQNVHVRFTRNPACIAVG